MFESSRRFCMHYHDLVNLHAEIRINSSDASLFGNNAFNQRGIVAINDFA